MASPDKTPLNEPISSDTSNDPPTQQQESGGERKSVGTPGGRGSVDRIGSLSGWHLRWALDREYELRKKAEAEVVRLQQEADEQEKLIAELRDSWDSWHKQLQEKKRVVERLREAADRVVNWNEPRIVPTRECPNLGVAWRLLRALVASLDKPPEPRGSALLASAEGMEKVRDFPVVGEPE